MVIMCGLIQIYMILYAGKVGIYLFYIDAVDDIDPYVDVIIPKENVSETIEMCELLLECEYLHEYEEYDHAIEILKETIKIAKEAQALDLGLVSSGD